MLFEMHFNQWGAVIGASLIAAFCDLRTQRIPNWLTLSAGALGLVYAGAVSGVNGLGEAIVAWIVVALPFIVLFVYAHGGAGDAKMMGAIGAWLGLKQGLITLCCVAIIGGMLAVMRMIAHRQRRGLFSEAVAMLYVHMIAVAGGRRGWKLLKTDADEQADGCLQRVTIPYGVAIFLGVCVGAVVVQVWKP